MYLVTFLSRIDLIFQIERELSHDVFETWVRLPHLLSYLLGFILSTSCLFEGSSDFFARVIQLV